MMVVAKPYIENRKVEIIKVVGQCHILISINPRRMLNITKS